MSFKLNWYHEFLDVIDAHIFLMFSINEYWIHVLKLIELDMISWKFYMIITFLKILILLSYVNWSSLVVWSNMEPNCDCVKFCKSLVASLDPNWGGGGFPSYITTRIGKILYFIIWSMCFYRLLFFIISSPFLQI
jgi:hypothetical protein